MPFHAHGKEVLLCFQNTAFITLAWQAFKILKMIALSYTTMKIRPATWPAPSWLDCSVGCRNTCNLKPRPSTAKQKGYSTFQHQTEWDLGKRLGKGLHQYHWSHYLLHWDYLGKGEVSVEERGMYSNPDFISSFNFTTAQKQDKQ